MAEKKAAERVWRAAGWVWLAAAWLAGVALMWRFGRSLLDSDMASEMVLADLLNREGGVLSQNWYYSTELRVFCQQLLFKLGLLVFPGSWHAARMLAQGQLSPMLKLPTGMVYMLIPIGVALMAVYYTVHTFENLKDKGEDAE